MGDSRIKLTWQNSVFYEQWWSVIRKARSSIEGPFPVVWALPDKTNQKRRSFRIKFCLSQQDEG